MAGESANWALATQEATRSGNEVEEAPQHGNIADTEEVLSQETQDDEHFADAREQNNEVDELELSQTAFLNLDRNF